MTQNVSGGVSYRLWDMIEIKYIKNDHWRVSGMSLKVDIIISKIDSRTICHSYSLEGSNQHCNPYSKNFRNKIFQMTESQCKVPEVDTLILLSTMHSTFCSLVRAFF